LNSHHIPVPRHNGRRLRQGFDGQSKAHFRSNAFGKEVSKESVGVDRAKGDPEVGIGIFLTPQGFWLVKCSFRNPVD